LQLYQKILVSAQICRQDSHFLIGDTGYIYNTVALLFVLYQIQTLFLFVLVFFLRFMPLESNTTFDMLLKWISARFFKYFLSILFVGASRRSQQIASDMWISLFHPWTYIIVGIFFSFSYHSLFEYTITHPRESFFKLSHSEHESAKNFFPFHTLYLELRGDKCIDSWASVWKKVESPHGGIRTSYIYIYWRRLRWAKEQDTSYDYLRR